MTARGLGSRCASAFARPVKSAAAAMSAERINRYIALQFRHTYNLQIIKPFNDLDLNSRNIIRESGGPIVM